MTGQRPPWLVVVRLPDDMTPDEAADQGLAMPWGARGLALCAGAAEQVLAVLPEDASLGVHRGRDDARRTAQLLRATADRIERDAGLH